MIHINFKPNFLRQLKKLPIALQLEAKEKIIVLQSDPSHPFLKTHKLKGELSDCYSFSVNYSYRIVFEYESKKEIALLAIGDHSVYD